MRHGVDGRKLGRNTPHRRALFRNLANSVIQQEQVVTTVAKAKEIRRVVDRLITIGKSSDVASKRLAFDRTRDRAVVQKLFGVLAERYKDRAGGYTRVLKFSETRRGDGAEMALLELVDHPPIARRRVPTTKTESVDEGAKDEASTSDPYTGFRKMFGKVGKKPKTDKA